MSGVLGRIKDPIRRFTVDGVYDHPSTDESISAAENDDVGGFDGGPINVWASILLCKLSRAG